MPNKIDEATRRRVRAGQLLLASKGCAKVAQDVDVSYSEVHVWRLLGGLGFSNQKPERRAIERNEDAVQEFKSKTWPPLREKPGGKSG